MTWIETLQANCCFLLLFNIKLVYSYKINFSYCFNCVNEFLIAYLKKKGWWVIVWCRNWICYDRILWYWNKSTNVRYQREFNSFSAHVKGADREILAWLISFRAKITTNRHLAWINFCKFHNFEKKRSKFNQ